MIQTVICHDQTDHLPKELVDFARRQIVSATLYKREELRSEGRYPMLMPVRAVPVDENGEPIGDEIQLVTRDISATGIGLIHTESIEFERLAIQISIAGTEVNLVAEVMWNQQLGPFYGAGAKFVEKLDEFVH